jgi:hypothetical protein
MRETPNAITHQRGGAVGRYTHQHAAEHHRQNQEEKKRVPREAQAPQAFSSTE